METLVIPAGEGRAFHLSEGQGLRIITPKGQQSADFFAFCADDISEWLSPPPYLDADTRATPSGRRHFSKSLPPANA